MQSEKLKRDIFFNKLKKKEYARLDKSGDVYLDYTGGNLYPKSLLDNHFNFLKNGVLGNPHSTNPTSALSQKMVSEARQTVLDFFNASDYYCVFTANATGALQIVGECYPFSPESHLLLTVDNHNSVNGIRQYCRNKGGKFNYTGINYNDLTINEAELKERLSIHPDKTNKLFAYPAQSNASGVQHSLKWVLIAQQKGWDVLLDVAAYVPTSVLDLSIIQPDFVAISFYKIFGYPTGIGCLLIKKSTFKKMKKPWFAGGTLSLSSVKSNGYFLKPDHEKFENGTINYLDIPAIKNGLNFITAIGMSNISNRIKDLSFLIISGIKNLRHNNGLPLIELYGAKDTENRGATFLLNFFDAERALYPFEKILQLANAAMISLRTGCFCNPGIDELIHCVSGDDIEKFFISREHGDYNEIIFLGTRRGAVRISAGLSTTTTDVTIFLNFARTLLNKKATEKPVVTLDYHALLSPQSDVPV